MKVQQKNDQVLLKRLPGFEDIEQVWDPDLMISTAWISPGEFYVTTSAEMISTVVGSSVSACIRDTDTGVGGMNHFLLPGDRCSNPEPSRAQAYLETRFGVVAMENLINEILKQGSRKSCLEVKLFGGGDVPDQDRSNVGSKNITFIRDFVRAEGLSVAVEELGGSFARKVTYSPQTGEVRVRKLRAVHKSIVADQEREYVQAVSDSRDAKLDAKN